MTIPQKSNLFSMLTVLIDSVLNSFGIRSKSMNNQISNMQYQSFLNNRDKSQLNNLLLSTVEKAILEQNEFDAENTEKIQNSLEKIFE